MPAPRATYFASAAAFRRWLEAHHLERDELLVGFHKRDTGRPSPTWSEAVDEALCFGWIDGKRQRVDEHRYTIRFTPRRRTSGWSQVNVKKMEALLAAGRVVARGLEAWSWREGRPPPRYSYENRKSAVLSPAERARFGANAKAWAFFQAWRQKRGCRR